jgi:YkoP domain
MRVAVRWIDNLLCKFQGVYVYSRDPECILRLQLRTSTHTLPLGSWVVHKGEPVLALHAWNERMPVIPPEGADLAWALTLRRRLVYSFMGIARLIQEDPLYEQVRAVCGSSGLFSFSDHTGGVQMMQRMGFVVIPYHQPFGRFGKFWENLFSWSLMWAYNTNSLNLRKFWRLQRTEIWMTRVEFVERYSRTTSQ